ncbi:DUF3108 domain-containing protein [Halopseudomonas salegens]|uniref:DUF3108 domain-containing protein n=1 Tax=Halopseudomonas salegens TaxID=1434072 RepID=UPI000B867A45|nr:DUF3108 domain-containing protein [Halopseudomonas salegens]
MIQPAQADELINAVPLKPFDASYTADMRRVPVNGEATQQLEQNADGSWTLTFYAGMFVARLTETSQLQLDNGQLKPLSYHYERSGLGRNRETRQTFDWDAGKVTGTHRDDPVDLATEDGLLDKASYQMALRRDLQAGKEELHYRVVDGRSIDEYEFEVVGSKQVETAVGEFAAVEVVRVRDPDASRQTTLWFAKDWDYLLVRLSQTESDGQRYQIMLKEATIDGEEVRGQ